MLAIGFTIGLFSFWGLIGCAVVRALRTRMPPLQEMLLAPVVGLVLTIVPVFILNRAGIPVARFGYPLTIALLVFAGALAVLAGRPRPFVDLPWRDYAPFAAVLLLALLLTGRPMFEYGLEWVSFCNDDMANYCLGAVRFYHHGFFEVPRYEDLARGVDYSLFYWFFHVPGMGRTGSELLIAWGMSISGLSPHQVFMPQIVAFHLCQISATGALVYRSREMKTPALATCLLLAGSALATFGVIYQLNSQVIGLALLAGAAAALMRPYGTPEIDGDGIGDRAPDGSRATARDATGAKDPARWRLLLRQGVLVGILMSGLFVMYPEVLPMLGLAWMIYVGLQLRRRRANPRAVVTIVLVAAATGVVLLWRHVPVVFSFIFRQSAAGAAGGELQNMFYPFYLLPSGVADLWGFFPLTRVPPEPVGSATILAAWTMLLVAAALAVWLSGREHPVAMLTAVMIALGVFLFFQRASFGLYKLAMFLQPFLWGTIAVAWLTLVPPRPATAAAPAAAGSTPRGRQVIRRAQRRQARKHFLRRFGPLVLLALPGVFVQQGYVQASRGRGQRTGFGELADPSATRINAEFRQLLAANGVPDGQAHRGAGPPPDAPRPPGGVVLDSYNIVLAKFQAVYARGTEAAYPSTAMGTAMTPFDIEGSAAPEWAVAAALKMSVDLQHSFGRYQFDLHDRTRPGTVNPFMYRMLGPRLPPAPQPIGATPATTLAPGPLPLFIGTGGRQTVFNRWNGRAIDRHFFALPLGRVRDHLVFTESQLGRGYYLSPGNIALYQLEPDPKFIPGTTMSAAGRHMLFEVVNPSPQVRMMLNISTSLRSDGDNALPPAAAIGAERQLLPIVGRGSARVFSPPLAVQTVAGRPFVAIDLGRDGGPFMTYRSGLMRLYGEGVSLDWRRLVAFARDISLVSERQYAAMKPPSQLQHFPDDVKNPHFEYSGLYEDGWVSDHAWFDLAPPWNASGLLIKGNVPDLGDPAFQTEITVSIDGEEVARRTLALHWNELTIPLPKQATPRFPGRRRIELRLTRYQPLPEPDGRPVTFQIGFIGWDTAPAAPIELRDVAAELANPLLEASGLDGDRWAAQKVSLRLTQTPDRRHLVVRGMVPRPADGAGGPGGSAGENFKTTLRVTVDGKPAGERTVGVGDFEFTAEVDPVATPTARRVELSFSATQPLAPPDPRTVSCQLTSIGFEPPPAPPTRLTRFPEDLRHPLLVPSGVYDDGWVAPTSSMRLRCPPESDELTVRGMVPRIGDDAAFQSEMIVLIDGQEVGRQAVKPGPVELRFPLPPPEEAADPTNVALVELRFSTAQTLPADGRSIGARLSLIGFTSPNEP